MAEPTELVMSPGTENDAQQIIEGLIASNNQLNMTIEILNDRWIEQVNKNLALEIEIRQHRRKEQNNGSN
jgi:hypothetical protein